MDWITQTLLAYQPQLPKWWRSRIGARPLRISALGLLSGFGLRPSDLSSHTVVPWKRRSPGNAKALWFAALAIAASFCFACAGWAVESSPQSNAPPRIAPAPATNALATFRVKPGFRLELVAAEPLIAAPVALAFDENARLFVVERGGDAGQRGTNAQSGRIRVLEDTEGAGHFHTSTVYADNLPRASAVACYGGGVFVAAGSDLIFLRDTQANGIADVRRVVFAGMGGTLTQNDRAVLNNLNWGLDNRFHAATAGLAGAPSGFLGGGDCSFDPRTLTLSLEPGPAQSGLTFDNWGRKFVCDPTHPLRTPMYEPRYLARNPYFPAPPALVDVASPATAIFRCPPAGPSQSGGGRVRAANPPARAMAQVSGVLVPAWLTNAQG